MCKTIEIVEEAMKGSGGHEKLEGEQEGGNEVNTVSTQI